MARYQHLPIWVAANRLVRVLELAVRQFPRYHKYTLGSDLRQQAIKVCRLIIRANESRERRALILEQLCLTVEDLKLLIQLAKEIKAFASFKQFQEAAE